VSMCTFPCKQNPRLPAASVFVVLRTPRLNLAMLSTSPSLVSLRQTEIALELSVLRIGNRLNGKPGMYLFGAGSTTGRQQPRCNFPTLRFCRDFTDDGYHKMDTKRSYYLAGMRPRGSRDRDVNLHMERALSTFFRV